VPSDRDGHFGSESVGSERAEPRDYTLSQ